MTQEVAQAMVKDFIDTNEFTREQLVDMIELSLAIKRAIRSGYYET